MEGLQGAGKSTVVGKLAEKFPKHRVFREGDYNPVELAWCSYLTKEQYEAVLGRYETLVEEMRENTTFEPAKKPLVKAEMAKGGAESKKACCIDMDAQGAVDVRKAGAAADHYVLTYTRIITDIPGFHKDLEQYEIYNGRVDRDTFDQIIFSRFAKWRGDDQIFECSIFQNIVENQILFYEMTDDEIVAFYKRLADVIKDREFKILYLDVEWVAGALEIIRKERVDAQGNEMWYPLMLGFLENCPHGKREGLKGFEGLVSHLEHRKALELRILREVFPKQAVILKSKDYDLTNIM